MNAVVVFQNEPFTKFSLRSGHVHNLQVILEEIPLIIIICHINLKTYFEMSNCLK